MRIGLAAESPRVGRQPGIALGAITDWCGYDFPLGSETFTLKTRDEGAQSESSWLLYARFRHNLQASVVSQFEIGSLFMTENASLSVFGVKHKVHFEIASTQHIVDAKELCS